MNAIIWWLESPWQLRALVFALSFFVCFVAPWLHNQSLLTSRVAARKLLEEKSETISVPKADVPHQDAEAQATVPAPQEQVPVQGKASPAPAQAMHEQAPSRAEAPVHAMQVPAEAPVQEEQASAPAPVAQASAPASAQVEPLPVETKTTAGREQVAAPAQAPVVTVPAMEERAPAPPPPAVNEAAGPSETKASARQEQAAVQTPAPSAASEAQTAGAFKIVSQSPGVIPVSAGSPVEKQEFAVSTENGGSAEVEVYVLSGGNLRRSNRVVDPLNGSAEVSAVLDSDVFAKAAALYDTVACVGLGSRSTGLSTQEIARLIDNRAVQLCGIIARKPYLSTNTKLYGLPLGQQTELARPENERAQKSLIIIGLRNTKSDLTDAAVQKKMISEIIRGGKITNLTLSNYSEVASGKELRYIEVKGASNNRPIKSSVVKPAYAPQREIHRMSPLRHKRCGAKAASRIHIVRSRKLSRFHTNADTSGRKTHSGCGLFDFPF